MDNTTNSTNNDIEAEIELKYPELKVFREQRSFLEEKIGRSNKDYKSFERFLTYCEKEERGYDCRKIASKEFFLSYFKSIATGISPACLKKHYTSINNCTISAYSKHLDLYVPELKEYVDNFEPAKTSVFTEKQFYQFLELEPQQSELFNILLYKVIFIFAICGHQSPKELFQLTMEDVEFSDDGYVVRKANNEKFVIPKYGAVSLTTLVDKYMLLISHFSRNLSATQKFFRNWNDSAIEFNKILTLKEIKQMPMKIASLLCLPDIDSYTCECFCKSASSIERERLERVISKRKLIHSESNEPPKKRMRIDKTGSSIHISNCSLSGTKLTIDSRGRIFIEWKE